MPGLEEQHDDWLLTPLYILREILAASRKECYVIILRDVYQQHHSLPIPSFYILICSPQLRYAISTDTYIPSI